eukprot:4069467-Prymnesium_polylepis.1
MPTSAASCVDIAPGSDPTISCGTLPSDAHACIRCEGQLTIALTTAGAQVNIDYVFLQPGEWGRYAGLPVLRSTVDALLDMGTKVIRQGGSFASVGAGSA